VLAGKRRAGPTHHIIRKFEHGNFWFVRSATLAGAISTPAGDEVDNPDMQN